MKGMKNVAVWVFVLFHLNFVLFIFAAFLEKHGWNFKLVG